MRLHGLFTFKVNFLLLTLTYYASADGTQTISALPAYTSLRICAQKCFYNNALIPAYDYLASQLSCNTAVAGGAENSCYCNTGLQPRAETYLSTCISGNCVAAGGFTSDVSAAVSIYESYCAANGYGITTPAVVSATTTAGQTAQQTSNVAGGTSTDSSNAANTDKPSSPTDSSSSGPTDGLTKPAEIATIIGTIVGVLTLVVTIRMCYQNPVEDCIDQYWSVVEICKIPIIPYICILTLGEAYNTILKRLTGTWNLRTEPPGLLVSNDNLHFGFLEATYDENAAVLIMNSAALATYNLGKIQASTTARIILKLIVGLTLIYQRLFKIQRDKGGNIIPLTRSAIREQARKFQLDIKRTKMSNAVNKAIISGNCFEVPEAKEAARKAMNT